MIEARLAENAALVEQALAACYATCDADFAAVCEAQRYALFAHQTKVCAEYFAQIHKLCAIITKCLTKF